MSLYEFSRTSEVVFLTGVMAGLLIPACRAGGVKRSVLPEQPARLEAMRAKGTQASLTAFPAVVGDSALKEAAEVLALLLERVGMTNLVLTDTVFRLPNEAGFDQAAALFGEFVRKNAIKTEYALYVQFVRTRATGVMGIRGVIVDRAGQSVLADLQTPADRDFKRAKPDSPMSCCVFLAERVRTQLGIPESALDDSGKGRIARTLAKKSPGPDEAEWTAMEQRQAAIKKAGGSAKLAVLLVRLSDDEVGENDSAHLADLLNGKKLCQAVAVGSPLRVRLQPSRNEQKVLWDLARAFKEHVRVNPPQADYALLADYVMLPSAKRAWAVHFVVCDRRGEWVIVDFQNQHHRDFQRIDPETPDDCGRLVAKRLQAYLQ